MLLINRILDWLQLNGIELLATLTGLAYIFYSIKQKLVTWFFGLVTSALYIFVFYQAKIYADMALQFYYVGVSILGWWSWTRGKQMGSGEQIQVRRLTIGQIVTSIILSIVIYLVIYFVLASYTDSPIPLLDAFTTALSIVATWMLARKFIEHWIIWIVVDGVSIGLYLYRELYITVILFVVYTIAAVAGCHAWKRDMQKGRNA